MDTQSMYAGGLDELFLRVVFPQPADAYKGLTIPLPREGKLLIGRGRECHVPIAHRTVSERHAELEIEAGAAFVRDVGSKNGTFVNGRRLAGDERIQLPPGCTLRLGTTFLFVVAGALPEAARAPGASDLAARHPTRFMAENGPMREVLERIQRLAPKKVDILLTGETGTGKTFVAKTIHSLSSRTKGEFVMINCAAIPDGLIESELFGHRRGAFVDAKENKPGIFEVASGGTLFLDEIADCSEALQGKLLHAIQERAVRRIGEAMLRPVDVRLVFATNRSLEDLVKAKRFREDLWFRLRTVVLHVPPLRERRTEIRPLAERFLEIAARKFDMVASPRLTPAAYAVLLSHPWPGNVRQLENAIEGLVALADGPSIDVDDVKQALDAGSVSGPSAQDAHIASLPVAGDECASLRAALERNHYNQVATAEELNVSRNTIRNRMIRFGIRAARQRRAR
jgi:two-component system response regulator AtoC